MLALIVPAAARKQAVVYRVYIYAESGVEANAGSRGSVAAYIGDRAEWL